MLEKKEDWQKGGKRNYKEQKELFFPLIGKNFAGHMRQSPIAALAPVIYEERLQLSLWT